MNKERFIGKQHVKEVCLTAARVKPVIIRKGTVAQVWETDSQDRIFGVEVQG